MIWWCHSTISSSVVPFSSSLQSFSASGSFQMSQLFASVGQSIVVSASTSVLLMNTQHWSPLRRTGCISLQSKGLSRVFSNTTVQKLQCSAFFIVQFSHPYMTTGKTTALTRWTFVGKRESRWGTKDGKKHGSVGPQVRLLEQMYFFSRKQFILAQNISVQHENTRNSILITVSGSVDSNVLVSLQYLADQKLSKCIQKKIQKC